MNDVIISIPKDRRAEFDCGYFTQPERWCSLRWQCGTDFAIIRITKDASNISFLKELKKELTAIATFLTEGA